MTTTVVAIYENGMLKLPHPLLLPERSHVNVTITDSQDDERSAWLKLSEEALSRTWDNSDGDIFNELLKK